MFKHDFPATNMNEVISTEFSLLRVAVVDASVDKWRAKEPGVEESKSLTVLAWQYFIGNISMVGEDIWLCVSM